MRITFETINPGHFLRHEISEELVNSCWVADPDDLSVVADLLDLTSPCELCLSNEPHSIRLHNRLLDPPRPVAPANVRILTSIIASLPWPVARKPVGAAGLAKDMSDDFLSQYRPESK